MTRHRRDVGFAFVHCLNNESFPRLQLLFLFLIHINVFLNKSRISPLRYFLSVNGKERKEKRHQSTEGTYNVGFLGYYYSTFKTYSYRGSTPCVDSSHGLSRDSSVDENCDEEREAKKTSLIKIFPDNQA